MSIVAPALVWAYMLRGHRDEHRNLVSGKAALIPRELAEQFKRLNPPAAREATPQEIAKARKRRSGTGPAEAPRPARQLKMEEDVEDPGEGDDGDESEGGDQGGDEGKKEGDEKPTEGPKRPKNWKQLEGAGTQAK